MTSYLLAGPAQEPISLAQAKAFLRIEDENTAEDGLIQTLITAARLHLEGVTQKALLAQSWRLVLDGWPPDRVVHLPVGPVRALLAVTAYGADGEPVAVPLVQFGTLPGGGTRLVLPARIVGAPGLRAHSGIEIDYEAGYGETADDVPADLRQALLVLVGYWFEHRDAVIVAGSGAVVPAGFDRLVAGHKAVRL